MTKRAGSEAVFWALHDVSFCLDPGRSLGIIGHNGAGKSTLLRLLCGLGRPTTGRIGHQGRISALLELGSGLHLDMTGRENIMTAGILSGLTKSQVLAQQDEIIAFSELEEFVDQPIRTYSTGMFLRLAFSAAIHFDPDILVIDEVLAVGDSRFQGKCLDKLYTFQKAGKTLIVVSHNIEQVCTLSQEVLVLEEGRVAFHGNPENAVHTYHELMAKRTQKRAAQLAITGVRAHPPIERGHRIGTQEATIDAVYLYDKEERIAECINSGEALTIALEYTFTKSLPDAVLTLGIFSESTVKCFEAKVPSIGTFGPFPDQGNIRCHLPSLPLSAGRYYVDVGLYPIDWSYVYDYHWQMHLFHVNPDREMSLDTSGIISIKPTWSFSQNERRGDA